LPSYEGRRFGRASTVQRCMFGEVLHAEGALAAMRNYLADAATPITIQPIGSVGSMSPRTCRADHRKKQGRYMSLINDTDACQNLVRVDAAPLRRADIEPRHLWASQRGGGSPVTYMRRNKTQENGARRRCYRHQITGKSLGKHLLVMLKYPMVQIHQFV
jgi:hypothetical protein